MTDIDVAALRACSACGKACAARRRDMCGACYRSWLRAGGREMDSRSVGEILFEQARDKRVSQLQSLSLLGPTKCWLWPDAAKGHGRGYGRIVISGKTIVAHRWAYEMLRGAIPEGLVLDHLCRNRGCVNPDHLEVVTQEVNVARGIGPTAINALKTHCPTGHPYDDQNTLIVRGGWRQCRACNNARRQRQRRRQAQLKESE